MKLRLILTIALLSIAPFVCRGTAYADVTTTDYVETGLNNRELMRWDFHCTFLDTCTGSPAGQQAWTSEVELGANLNRLVFTSTHIRGPHDLIDIDPGATFDAIVPFAALEALQFQNEVFTLLASAVELHPASPEQHFDIVQLFARRSPQGGFDFVLRSTHVPEPTAMFLLGTGLAAVAMKLRKRQGLRKE